MRQLSRLGSFLLLLVLSLNSFSSRAQTDDDDDSVVVVSRPARPTSEVVLLKKALQQPISSVETADSLLAQARHLAYLPGQVVALSHLAGIRLRQQQPEQAKALLQEAEKIAPQLHDLSETGWAMSQLGRLQGRYARTSPSFLSYSASLFRLLNEAMGSTVALSEKRRARGRATPPPADDEPAVLSPAVLSPEVIYGGVRKQNAQLKLNQIDKWLDTLLTRSSNPPQVVQQLKVQRKLRDSNQALSQAYAKEGDYAQAYRYFLQYSAYKDSLTAEATTRRLAALEYKQNLLKKEAQIQRLTKERLLREQAARRQQQFVLALASCVAGLMGFAFVLSRNNRAKQLANRQLSEQKETLQQTLTALKTTQDQLIQAEKMASLGELTAGIAHEIQNPLNFVNNFSEVSNELMQELKEARQQEPRDPELEQDLLDDVQQNLQKISQHGNRASAIVRGMLEHARSSSGAGQKEPTDLNALTEEYAQLAYHGVLAKDSSFEARLTISLDPNLGPVPVVPQEISRVLMNVFSNAFYAVQKKQASHAPGYQPEISVRTKREGEQVKIQIRDNGIGVPAELKQKIFQPFFTTKPTGQGTGLGLSLSYDIITKGHGGTFTLESEEGQFTELTLTLPTVAS
ncbi:ATP-binding protein [Hymenobacter terrenus]|uniref:ATP-binding protein n=1 Tax=Hymenobacter terrenus TaxID=1629124 RepID=UPI000619BC79|nr:ATP-binding protein [Hymenobacter terrenus]